MFIPGFGVSQTLSIVPRANYRAGLNVTAVLRFLPWGRVLFLTFGAYLEIILEKNILILHCQSKTFGDLFCDVQGSRGCGAGM